MMIGNSDLVLGLNRDVTTAQEHLSLPPQDGHCNGRVVSPGLRLRLEVSTLFENLGLAVMCPFGGLESYLLTNPVR